MKGATGLRFFSLRSMACTTKVLSRTSATMRSASWAVRMFASWPLTLWSLASKGGGCCPASVAVMVQYSSERKASRSRSRSQTSLTATDCTRPMLRPRRTFFHSNWLPW